MALATRWPIVSQSNVLVGQVIDPRFIYWATILKWHVFDISGPIDIASYLNHDEPHHQIHACVVVHACVLGSYVVATDSGQWMVATVSRQDFGHFGFIQNVESDGCQYNLFTDMVDEERCRDVVS